jgi:hypothetical protein
MDGLPLGGYFLEGLFEIVRVHDRQELDGRIDIHEQGFGDLGDLRRIGHVEDPVSGQK